MRYVIRLKDAPPDIFTGAFRFHHALGKYAAQGRTFTKSEFDVESNAWFVEETTIKKNV